MHFDAHLDTWDTYMGAAYTHGTPFRRASEEGLLDTSACLHVGTRGPLYGRDDLRADPASASRWSAAWSSTTWARAACSNGSATGWATALSTARSTSTCSTRRSHPAPARPRRAA